MEQKDRKFWIHKMKTENFIAIYEDELARHENTLEKEILSSTTVRAFVYEICKGYMTRNEENEVNHERNSLF